MAIGDDVQDKSEQPTERKREDTRKAGNVAYSREFAGAVLLLGALAALKYASDPLANMLEGAMRRLLGIRDIALISETGIVAFLRDLALKVLSGITPIILILFVMAAAVGYGQI